MSEKGLSDKDISLIKGFREHYPLIQNQQIVYYISTYKHVVNLGRISDYMKRKNNQNIPIADKKTIDDLIERKKSIDDVLIDEKESYDLFDIPKDKIGEQFMNILQNIKDYNENEYIDFKQQFNNNKSIFVFKENPKLIKLALSFANNSGGFIFFGIGDNKEIIGMNNDNIQAFKCDEKEFHKINHYSTSTITISKYIHTIQDKYIGALYIHELERENKPTIVKANIDKIQLGSIFYRYSSENELIKKSELDTIYKKRYEISTKDSIIQYVNEIFEVGVDNTGLLNLTDGNIKFHGNKIELDEELIEKLNVIKEGEFVEKEGALAIKLVADVKEYSGDMDNTHPYIQKEFNKQLEKKLKVTIVNKKKKQVNIGRYTNQLLLTTGIWKNKSYHIIVHNGKNNMHRLNDRAIVKLCEFIESQFYELGNEKFFSYLNKLKKPETSRKKDKE